MDKDNIKEKILQWQLLADQLFQAGKNAFMKKWNGDINFCEIVLVGETKITVDIYAPEQRAGTRDSINWLEIETFNEVRGVEE